MHDIEHMFYIKSAGRVLSGTTFGGTERGDEELFYFHTLCTKMEKILFSVPLLPLVRKIERGDSGGGFAFLWKNHAGCGAPPAHRQEPAFESTLTKEKRQPLTGSPFFWWRRVDSNHRSRRQQIYSLPPLATRELLHMKLWSWWTDSNPRPADYKSAALPAELHQHMRCALVRSDVYSSRKEADCQQVKEKNVQLFCGGA